MTKDLATLGGLYLTFKLGEEMFSLDVFQVREVLELIAIARVPRAPEFLRGVINVRGSVVPVVDLRTKFGMSRTESTLHTRIIVMELNLDGEVTVVGALADSVHDVAEIDAAQIEPPPRIGSRWQTEFVKAIGKRNEDFLMILDIDRVFSSDELTVLDATGDRKSNIDDKDFRIGDQTNVREEAVGVALEM